MLFIKMMTRLAARSYRPAIAFLLVLPAANLFASLSHLPGLSWHTLETPNFLIHYHQPLETTARRLSGIAESVHGRLRQTMNWQPRRKTHVVLSDETDLANGAADSVPYNFMFLNLIPPVDVTELKDYADWLETLFVHEYTHVLHLDKAYDGPDNLRYVLGRMPLLFPNRYQPLWLVEGLATWHETDRQRGIGRGQNSYFEMQMRLEVDQGIKPLRQVNQLIRSWPAGSNHYLYGVHFYQFLEQDKGKDAIYRYVDGYSGRLVPFFINTNSRHHLGANLSTLWKRFEVYLKDRYGKQLKEIRQRGLVGGERLGEHNYRRLVVTMDDRQRLYTIGNDGFKRPQLWTPGASPTPVNSFSHLSVHSEAGILLTQPEIGGNSNIQYDLYLKKPNQKLRRLTHGKRFMFATWDRYGKSIYAAGNSGYRGAIYRLDHRGATEKQLWAGKAGEVVAYLQASPAGEQLLTVKFTPGLGWDLALFDVDTGHWRSLTHHRALVEHPAFTADGAAVVYSADYDGVYNIYRLALNDSDAEPQRLTNVIGGAFYPQLLNNGDLVYSGYHAKGFDLYRLANAMTMDSRSPARDFAGRNGGENTARTAVAFSYKDYPEATKPRRYNALPYLAPKWWFPQFLISQHITQLGLTTSGFDPLNRHQYALTYVNDSANDIDMGGLQYVYDRLPLTFILEWQRDQDYIIENQQLLAVREEDQKRFSILLPKLGLNRSWYLQLGAVQVESRDSYLDPIVLPRPAFSEGVAGISIGYDSGKRFPLSISTGAGSRLSLTWESHDAISESFFSGQATTVQWRRFASLGGEHVLAMQFNAGIADDTARPYRLGGYDNSPPVDVLSGLNTGNRFYVRNFPLRGYSNNRPELLGTRFASAGVEWRFPLWRLERGIMIPPLAIDQWHGAFFLETGDAWGNNESFNQNNSAGFELNTDLVFGYAFLPVSISAGYARGFGDNGEEQVYFRVGTSF